VGVLFGASPYILCEQVRQLDSDRYAVTRSGTNTVLYLDKTALLEYAKKLAHEFLEKKSV